MSRRIAELEAELFRVPLDEVLADAKHGDHTHFELVTVRIRTSDGLEGTGYTYTGGFGGRAILAMIIHDLRSFLIGQDATAVEAIHDALQWRVHYVGRGGIASFAISAIDLPSASRDLSSSFDMPSTDAILCIMNRWPG